MTTKPSFKDTIRHPAFWAGAATALCAVVFTGACLLSHSRDDVIFYAGAGLGSTVAFLLVILPAVVDGVRDVLRRPHRGTPR